MTTSPAVETAIQRWVARLDHDFQRLQRCTVSIEQPHHHHRRRNLFHVKVDVTVPGRELVMSRDPERDVGHRNVYVALAEAFRGVRRRLRDTVRIRRGHVKHHRD